MIAASGSFFCSVHAHGPTDAARRMYVSLAGHFQVTRPSPTLVEVFKAMVLQGFGVHVFGAEHDDNAPSAHQDTSGGQRVKPRYTPEEEEAIQNCILFPVWTMQECQHNATGAAPPVCVPDGTSFVPSHALPAVSIVSSGGPPAEGLACGPTGPALPSSGPAQGHAGPMSVNGQLQAQVCYGCEGQWRLRVPHGA